jgi:hypothetical protein
VLLGDSGTGKTHLLIGLGIAACEQARRVRYATCAQLVNELVEAADERRLARLVARYGRLDLLLIDEVGYVQLDTRGAELLFQVLTEREEKSSIGLASNLPFSEWGGIIADARLVAAVIDRVPSTPTSSRRAPSPTATAPAAPGDEAAATTETPAPTTPPRSRSRLTGRRPSPARSSDRYATAARRTRTRIDESRHRESSQLTGSPGSPRAHETRQRRTP